MAKKPQTYPLRYVEDFFDVSNDVAVKLSKCAAGNHFRQALYRALSKRGNPRLSTLHGILKAAGLRIVFEAEKKAA